MPVAGPFQTDMEQAMRHGGYAEMAGVAIETIERINPANARLQRRLDAAIKALQDVIADEVRRGDALIAKWCSAPDKR